MGTKDGKEQEGHKHWVHKTGMNRWEFQSGKIRREGTGRSFKLGTKDGKENI